MSVVLMLILQSAGAALPIDFDLAHLPAADRLAILRRCGTASNSTDIIVCGSRHDRTAVPAADGWTNPDDTPDDARVTRGTGMAALTPVGACGMFAGQRDCNKAEMRHFGYGRGRDPVTFVGKLATKLLGRD
ncbi:hypothetical protein [Sphingomonas glacialis]|uniref:Uncharacterized protein n=1 Tax=Sphingomonas glacialis TaxID=658225 RepID=A0A502FV85_9SPHN|nr:hypothetical protein [Sphingomonas glacialis]TPG53006.1 hypothetical protein EAH76_14300 [Sphingomonas glacialis]